MLLFDLHAWFRSNISSDAGHATCFAVLPKNSYFSFSDDEIMILFRRLLYMDCHLHISGVTKCCEHPKHKNCDPQGTQMFVCKKGGAQIDVHDNLNHVIQTCLSVAGFNSRREDRIYDNSDKKPDITIRNFPQSTDRGRICIPLSSDAPDGRVDKLAIDTSIVHPLPGPNAASQLSLGEADRPLRAAATQYSAKNNKYRYISEQIGYKFLPIIFESSGKMHHQTSNFFKILLNTVTAGLDHVTANISNFYWTARISCCLQKSIASNLLKKYDASNGKSVRGLNFSHAHRQNEIQNQLVRLTGDVLSLRLD